ncbi:MAG: prenyltransferase [Vulcanisaeta sp. AZ3]|jgi:1,4-dihydroxy-2-naphthoate octaprenyltransferase
MRISEFLGLVRAWSLFMTVAVFVVGVGYAYFLGLLRGVGVLYALIALIGVLLLHVSVNVLNDYFDFRHGVDTPGSPTAVYRRHPILSGVVGLRTAVFVGFVALVGGVLLGLYLVFVVGLWVLVFGLIGVFLVYAYTGPPFVLKYRALGEVVVALTWGPLLIGGFFVVASLGVLVPSVFLVSIPPMLVMLAIIYSNNYRDREYDRRAGITTLAMLTGRFGFVIYVSSLVLALVITVVLSLVGVLPVTSLLALVTVVLVPGLVRSFRLGVSDIDARTGRFYTLFCLLYGVGIAMGHFV